MGDTELGTEDDDVDVDVDLQASASVELRSRWVDEATEVIVDRRGVEVAAVCGDPDVTPPSAQPDDGEAYFSRWHSHEDVARDQEPDASITKKRTIRHLVSLNPAHTAEHRRALQNEQRWRTEVGLLDGPVRAINLGLGDLETRLRLPPETIGRLPHVLGWWIDMGDGLAEGELAERGARGPFLSICQRRLDGRTLHDLVPSTTGLQPSDAADITEAAALTLSGVHDAGHWFGDISEHNLLAYAYWHSDDGATSSPSRLVRPRLRRRWLVNLCDVEQLAFRGSEEPGGMLWGATKPYATVMPGDRGPSYESELANLAYRACLLFFGRTKENQCPSGPDPESGLPTPLIGLLRRAGRSAELRRASHDGVLAPELRSIADFGRWVRILTPLPDERPGSYVARVDTACNRSSVSTAVLADLISWARSPGGPTSDSLALAYAAKIALENAERFDDVDRARFEAAELLVKAVNAVDVQRLRALLDAAGLDPATLRADINPNKHGEAIARLAQAYPEAGWQQPATPPGATTTRALRPRRS